MSTGDNALNGDPANQGIDNKPALNLSNWHPGDTHVHSRYSRLNIKTLVETDLLGEKWIQKETAKKVQEFTKKNLNDYDGKGEPEDIVEKAFEENGLSWITMTEHGPNLGIKGGEITNIDEHYDGRRAKKNWREEKQRLSELMAQRESGCILMCEELGTVIFSGHLLVYGIQDCIENALLDYNQYNFLKSAAESGGFCFIAHPFVGRFTPGPSRLMYWWRHFEDDLDLVANDTPLRGFELLNHSYPDPAKKEKEIKDKKKTRLLDVWDQKLSEGRRIFIVGGTDAHQPEKIGKAIKTYAFIDKGEESLSQDDHQSVLDALRAGRSVATTGPVIIFTVRNRRSCQVATCGGELDIAVGDELEVAVRGKELKDRKVNIKSSLFNASASVDSTVTLRVPDDLSERAQRGSYLRLETEGGKSWCYTNPVFLVTGSGYQWVDYRHLDETIDATRLKVSSKGDVWLVDTEGRITCLQDSEIIMHTRPNEVYVKDISIDSDNALVVGSGPGKKGHICRYDGDKWVRVYSTGSALCSVGLTPTGKAWAGGQELGLIHYDGEQWGRFSSRYGASKLACVDDDNVWAAYDGGILYYDGFDWEYQYEVGAEIAGLCATDHKHVWAVDVEGNVHFYNGHFWWLQYDTDHCFTDVFALDPENVWATATPKEFFTPGLSGNSGSAIRNARGFVHYYNGSFWRLEHSAPRELTSVYSPSKEWVLAVGNDGIFSLGRIFKSPETRIKAQVAAEGIEEENNEEQKRILIAREKLQDSLGRLFGKLKRD